MQQRGNDADEDVGEDQLAADAPEQLPPDADEQPPDQVADSNDESRSSPGC